MEMTNPVVCDHRSNINRSGKPAYETKAAVIAAVGHDLRHGFSPLSTRIGVSERTDEDTHDSFFDWLEELVKNSPGDWKFTETVRVTKEDFLAAIERARQDPKWLKCEHVCHGGFHKATAMNIIIMLGLVGLIPCDKQGNQRLLELRVCDRADALSINIDDNSQNRFTTQVDKEGYIATAIALLEKDPALTNAQLERAMHLKHGMGQMVCGPARFCVNNPSLATEFMAKKLYLRVKNDMAADIASATSIAKVLSIVGEERVPAVSASAIKQMLENSSPRINPYAKQLMRLILAGDKNDFLVACFSTLEEIEELFAEAEIAAAETEPVSA